MTNSVTTSNNKKKIKLEGEKMEDIALLCEISTSIHTIRDLDEMLKVI
ncbi:MAG: hypothetical protein JJV91_00470, partial [Desulfosarcina sp.]|nr:hypothetical protein [Desulfobacterales bacterium]